MQCSAFNLPLIKALIAHLQARVRNPNHPLKESDFSKLMFAILPYYFKYIDNYTISPEMWNDNFCNRNGRSDGIVALTNLNINDPKYGCPLAKVMYECKNKWTISWKKLCDNQLWEQADANKNDDGRLWVIGQIGFQVCVFNFDVLDQRNRDNPFEHFTPLNLNKFSIQDLDYLGIKYEYETINNRDNILAISWTLDDKDQHRFIHDMLDFISKNDPK